MRAVQGIKRTSQRAVLSLLMGAVTFAAEKGLDRLAATKPSAAAAGTALGRESNAKAPSRLPGFIRHEHQRE
jgi:hypothetical protein